MPLLAFGTGEGLLGYGICVPCSKRLPGVRDAFSEAYRAKSSTCRTGRIFSARNGPRSEVIRLKRGRPLSLSRLFGPVSYFDGIVRSPEAAYCLLISS